ncbi:MAG: hypothetical protein ACKVQS_01895 [Fimbriimonadaceae bacterium]
MRNYNQGNSKLNRFAVSLFALSIAVLAVAQPRPVVEGAKLDSSQRLKTGEVRELKKLDKNIQWSTVDTSKMFPAIARSFTARGVRPSNPSIEIVQPFSLEEVIEMQKEKQNPAPLGSMTASTSLGLESKFPGIGFTGSMPPDTHMAVGPYHIVEVVNSSVAFYDKKTGKLQYLQPLSSTGFLPKSGEFVFDPRVVYDQDHQQFIVLALDVDFNNELTYVHLAFSDDSNPNGKWKIAKIDNEFSDNNGNKRWGDYPNMTTSPNSVVMTFNHFPFGNGSVSGTVFVFRTSDQQIFAGNSGMFGMQMSKKMTAGPGVPVGLGVTFPFRVGNVNVNPTAQMMGVNDLVDPPTLSGFTVNLPVFVRQANGAGTAGFNLDTIGDRMMDASTTNDDLVFGFTCNYGPDGNGYTQNSSTQNFPTLSKVRWGEIKLNGWPLSANNPSLIQSGDLKTGDPNSGVSYLMPAIAKNLEGSIAIIATQANFDGVPNAIGAGRRPTDPLGSMGPAVVYGMSNQNVFVNAPTGVLRWGDYAGIGLDPQISDTFWGAHELIKSTSLAWGTEIYKVRIKNSDITPRNVLSVTPIFGTNTAGNASSFAVNGDSNVYTLDSEFVGNRGNYAGYEVVFDGTGLKDGARVDFTSFASIEGVSGFIYAFNNLTNNYDLLTSTRLKTTPSTYVQDFPQSYFARYRNTGTGEIKLRFVALNTVQRRGVNPIPFQFSTDFGVLTINTL